MILAHAFGQRYELPIPLLIFILAGAAVVVLSFMLIVVRPVSEGPEDSAADVPTLGSSRVGRGAFATVVLVALVICGFEGSQVVSENLLPTLFWLIVWIAVPLSTGVLPSRR